MALDAEPPESPDLTNRPLPSDIDPEEVIGSTDDLRREELEEILRDGAWDEAFREWAEYTDLTDAEYEAVREFGLIEKLDVYWDPIEEELQFEVSNLPAALNERGELAAVIASELTALGQTVVEMLEDGYVEWGREDTTTDDVWNQQPLADDVPES